MRVALASLGVVCFAVAGCLTIGPTDTSTTTTGTSTGTSSTGSTTSSSASGGTGCDSQPSCDACTNCATMNTCATQVAACQNNSACIGLDQCIQLCGTTPDCASQCEQQNLGGVDDYNAEKVCFYCTACPTKCAGFAMCTKG